MSEGLPILSTDMLDILTVGDVPCDLPYGYFDAFASAVPVDVSSYGEESMLPRLSLLGTE